MKTATLTRISTPLFLRKIFLVLLAIGLSASASFAQVSVTATAGTTGPTPYTTVGAAFTAINGGTHQGAVTIDINGNTNETGPAVLNSSGAGSAAYTSLLMRPTVDGISIAGPTATGRGIIELNGADNVTIDGDNPNSAGTNRNLTIQNTAIASVTFNSVIRVALATTIVTSADNDTFRNLVLVGNAFGRNIASATSTTGSENTTYGILATGGASTVSATTAPTAISSTTTTIGSGATATNLTIQNNSISTAARAIAVQGSATTVFPGLLIENNALGNATAGAVDGVYSIGVTAQGSTNAVIRANVVYVEGFVGTSIRGIDTGTISSTGSGFTFERNQVNRVLSGSTTGLGAYGINVVSGNSHVVRNNFVGTVRNVANATFSQTNGAFGIRIGAGTGHLVYHNSVNMYGNLTGTGSALTAAAVVTSTSLTGIDMRNNIFVNNQTESGATTPASSAFVALSLPSGGTSAMNLTLNNNDYYNGAAPTVNQGVGQAGTTAGTQFYTQANFDPATTTPSTNLRSYTSTLSAAGTNDNASKKVNPQFVSNTDLHIPAGTVTLLESTGAPVGVTTDIDNEARSATTPDIGADEFNGVLPPANDIAATAIVTPANGSSLAQGSTVSPQASFTNVGTATQANVMVQFTITGPGGYSYSNTQTIATIAANQTVTVTFATTPAFTSAGSYTSTASVTTPDANAANDQVTGTFQVLAPLAGGTYNVPGDYPSLTNPGGIFAALNAAGASGNIVINIAGDLAGETGANALNELAGGFTVLIKPSGAARTISGTTTALGLIILNGADNVTIDGSLSGGTDRSLTILNSNISAADIWIRSASASNGATSNTVKNCNLNGPVAKAIAGVLAGGNAFGTPADAPNNNNTVQNNLVTGMQNGLFLSGNATTFDQNWLVTGNTFGSAVPADKLTFRGMLLGGANNFTITQNVIMGVTTSSSSTTTGIQLSANASNGSVTRNTISDVKNTNTGGFGANGIFLAQSTAAANVTVANNFIRDVAGFGFNGIDQADNGYGIVVASGGGYKIYFNSVSLTTNQTAAGSITSAVNILAAVTTAASIDLRDNILSDQETIGTRYGVINSSTQAAAVFLDINYNDYFAQNVGRQGATTFATLAAWQGATGKDANSKAVNPLFVSATDLHITQASTLNGMATPIAGITTDIDGDTRSATPDIGADEITVAGSVQFSAANYNDSETNATHAATITVTRAGGSDGSVTVQYATSDGTATLADNDYITASGTVTWADGDTSAKIFTVMVVGDTTFEPDETVNLTLSAPTGGATLGSPNPATLTILNDDVANTAPTITAQPVSRQAGSASSNSTIATVNDAESGPGAVVVTVTSANPSNGVTISNIVNTAGTVTADVVADCTATTATFTLQASDGSLTATDTLTVTVTPNSAPTLTYNNASVALNGATTINPATGPTDNGSVSTIVVQSQGTYTGTISVDSTTGVVSVSNAAPVGTHTITIRATDNCGLNTDATFTLTVNAPACVPPSTVYVDDNFPNPTPGQDPDGAGPATNFGCDSFATIQEGVDGVASGGLVNVADGLYTENVTISQPLTLTGAGAATVKLQPAVSNPNCGGGSLCGSNMILVQANNVTISGLTLDGDNPGLTSGVVVGGADLDARTGIATNHNLGVYSNLVVHDTTLKNIYLRGVSASSGGSFNINHNIAQNIQGEPGSIALFNFGGAGFFDQNNVSASYDGIVSNHSMGTQFTSNTVTDTSSGIHTDNPGDAGASTNDLIAGNTVTNSQAGGVGIFVFTAYKTVTIQDNLITNTDNGVIVFGMDPTLTNRPQPLGKVTIPGRVSPLSVNVRDPLSVIARTLRPAPAGVVLANAAELTGNYIDGQNKLNSTGAYFTTNQFGFGFGDTRVKFDSNTVLNNTDGFYLEAEDGYSLTLSASFNRIIDNSNSAVTHGTSAGFTGTVTAAMENNWWGCNAGPNNAGCGAIIGSGIDFDPWIVLKASATPSTIPPGGTSMVATDMTMNSDNATPTGGVLPDMPVNYTATNGTVSPASSTVVAGMASTTFTSTNANSAVVTTTVDNQMVNTPIGVTAPAFSIDDVTMSEGDSGFTNFTFTVTKTGATPFTSTVDVATMDGTATAPSDYTAIPTTTLTFAPGDTTMQVMVQVNGDTTFEPDETFTVELSNPMNSTISDSSGTGTIVNDDGAPTFTVSDVTLAEGNVGTTPFVFTVTKVGATGQSSTVTYATVGGTATTADNDYQPTSGTLVFGPSDTSMQVTVMVNGDTKAEPDETFQLVLTSVMNDQGERIEGSVPAGTGTIVNDDANPSFSIDNVTQAEGDAGTTNFTFTVTKNGDTALTSSVDVATQDGTATAPSDYIAIPPTTLTFAPGDTAMQVMVQVNGDTVAEPDETFTVQLSNAVNATIATPFGTGTIQNDDAPSAITVTPAVTPTATDNDYTRINDAVQTIASGGVITLSGAFNWTEPNAAASWATGSDYAPGTLDDYSILVPAGLSGVTFTASNLGAASIQGPGDLPQLDLEGVFFFNVGPNPNWTISNIQFLDFDLTIGMFDGGTAGAFSGTKILNNFIRMATDSSATTDTVQNIGIHLSFGMNQMVSGNTIDIQGNGVSVPGNFAADIALQSNTSGGNIYDGLQITNNVVRVLSAQSANPEVIIGIWENAHGHSSNITVSGNAFTNLAAGNDPALNLQRGFRVTSHSSATTTVTYATNTVSGANIGFQWISGSTFAGNQPVVVTGNTITGNDTGVLVQSQGQALLDSNTITGSGAASTGVREISGLATVDIDGTTISGAGTAVSMDATNSGTDPVTMRITNSTLSGNTAATGGALNSTGTNGLAQTTITNSTLTGNSPSGPQIALQDASLTVGNSIFNTKPPGANISASGTSLVTSLGYNLSSDNFQGFLTAAGDQTNKDAILGPLKNNGGPTFTHAPLTGSPAIDQGKDSGPVGPAYTGTGMDQRGFTRPQTYNDPSITPPAGGDGSDIGAVELAPGVIPQSAASRKMHGAAGTFDVPLSLNGPVEIECRSGGATGDYQLVLNFATPVTYDSAAVTSGVGAVTSVVASGPTVVTINLSGVLNLQRLTVGLFGVSDGANTGDVGVRVGILVGDITGNGSVNSADVGLAKAQSGQPVATANFRNDVNANGAINAADVALVKSQSGQALPPVPAEPDREK